MLAFVLVATLLVTASVSSCTSYGSSDDVKIVGGHEVDIQDFPYQVSITDQDGFWCGGSIVGENHVLTAGHCVRFAAQPMTVRAGSEYTYQGGSTHSVVGAIYIGDGPNEDIGVLTVEEPFEFDETRQPIELLTKDATDGTVATISGWGDVIPQARGIARKLRAVDVPLISRQLCNKLYNSTIIGEIHEGQVCAGDVQHGGRDACHGDSGSPLVVHGKVAGVASMGRGCARQSSPGVYGDVAYWRDWILKNIEE